MGYWPDGALTRDEVELLLGQDCDWRVDWCAGSKQPPTNGSGPSLPSGVLERVPSRARRRKIDRGLNLDKTWVFVFETAHEGRRLLKFQEGP